MTYLSEMVYVDHPVKGTVKFEPREFQKDFASELLGYDNLLVNSSRQLGESTMIAAVVSYICLAGNKKVCIVDNSGIKCKIIHILENNGMMGEVNIVMKSTIKFINGSCITFKRHTDLSRATSYDFVFIDNMSSIVHDLALQLYDMYLACSGKIVISGKLKKGSFFYKLWESKNNFKRLQYPFFLNSELDGEFAKKQIEMIGLQNFLCELACTPL